MPNPMSLISKFFSKLFSQKAEEYPPMAEAGGVDINLMFKNLNEETHKGTGSAFYTPMASSGNDSWLGGLQGMDKVSGVFQMPQVDGEDEDEAFQNYLLQVTNMNESEAVTRLAELVSLSETEVLAQAKKDMGWNSE